MIIHLNIFWPMCKFYIGKLSNNNYLQNNKNEN